MTFDPDKPMPHTAPPAPTPAYHPSVEHIHSKPLILTPEAEARRKAKPVRKLIEAGMLLVQPVEPETKPLQISTSEDPGPRGVIEILETEIDSDETPKKSKRKRGSRR